MAYYLSKENKEWFDSNVVVQLNKGNNTFATNNISRLEHIVRSALTLEEYSWIKERYIIKVKSNKLIFSQRELTIEVEEVFSGKEQIVSDFLDILNSLLLSPSSIKFNGYQPTPSELQKLSMWAEANGYKFNLKQLMFIKNENQSNSEPST